MEQCSWEVERRQAETRRREADWIGESQALTEYLRSPSSTLVEVTAKPSFLLTVPERKPRTLCACHPVAIISSARVAPSGRFNKSRMLAALLPSRATRFFAALGAFFDALVLLPTFPFLGATCAPCAPTLAFFLAFGFSGAVWEAVSSVIAVIVISLGGVSAIT